MAETIHAYGILQRASAFAEGRHGIVSCLAEKQQCAHMLNAAQAGDGCTGIVTCCSDQVLAVSQEAARMQGMACSCGLHAQTTPGIPPPLPPTRAV